MSKIVLLGSGSELGNSVAEKFRHEYPNEYLKTLLVGRDSTKSDIEWNPKSYENFDFTKFTEDLNLVNGDLVIFAFAKFVPGLINESLDELDLVEISETIYITGLLSSVLLIEIFRKLVSLGGGKIILFSSAAAKPPLGANIFYASSKELFDNIAVALSEKSSETNVSLTIVRPGFVPTKMNSTRKKTALSTTVEDVSDKVLRKFPKNEIWIPASLKYVSWFLTINKNLRKLANKKIKKSFNYL